MFVSFILLWICVLFLILCLKCQRPKNFPPGPPPLPILGNLLSLSLDNPIRDFERVRKTLTWDSYIAFNCCALIISHTHSYLEAVHTKYYVCVRSFLLCSSPAEEVLWKRLQYLHGIQTGCSHQWDAGYEGSYDDQSC